MYRNSKGVLVPHCEDCYYADKECPEDAVAGEIPMETGVSTFPCYQQGERMRRRTKEMVV